MTRNLDATRSPMAFFGAELRRARLAAGLSQDQLGRELNFSGDLVGKIETCERAPAPAFASGCDGVFPHLDGLFSRLLGLAPRWEGPYRSGSGTGLTPSGKHSRCAGGSRCSCPACCRPPTTPVRCSVLHRLIGSRKIMYDQLLHLADTSCRPGITVQVVPAEVGTHAGLLGAFIVAGFDSSPSILYAETAVEGQAIEKAALVSKAALAFDRLRAEALPRGAARDLIGKVAEERWKE